MGHHQCCFGPKFALLQMRMNDNRDDVISITDKTFDLTIDDSFPDIAGSNDISEQDHQTETSTAVDLNEFLTDKDLVGPSTSNNSHNERLMSSINLLKSSADILSRTCCNDIIHYSTNGDYSLEEIERLSDSVNKLAEACELKLNFIQKNYRFLERVYDTLGREHESLKKSGELKITELRELQLKNKELERQLHERQKIRNENINSDIILRQQKEIKEYKRFIKELMERE